ncbi:MAG: hypothetical protein Q7S57_00350 [bacterium]|nr:hypothetical protein [bacterium]
MFQAVESMYCEIEPEEESRTCRDCVVLDQDLFPLSRRTNCKFWFVWLASSQLFVLPLVFGLLASKMIICTLYFFLFGWVLIGLCALRAQWIRNVRGSRYYFSLDRLCSIGEKESDGIYDPPNLHTHMYENDRYLRCGGGPLSFVSELLPPKGSTVDRPMEGMILKIAWGWRKKCELFGCRSKNWPRIEVLWPKKADEWAMLTIWDEEGESHSVRLFHIGELSVFAIDHELVVLLRTLAACENWRSVLKGAVKYEDAKPKEPFAVAMDVGDSPVGDATIAHNDTLFDEVATALSEVEQAEKKRASSASFESEEHQL